MPALSCCARPQAGGPIVEALAIGIGIPALAQLDRIDLHPQRGFVDRLFQRESHRRPAGTAERRTRRQVADDVEVGEFLGFRRIDQARQRRDRRIDRGAGVGIGRQRQRLEIALLRRQQRDLDFGRRPIAGDGKLFVTIESDPRPAPWPRAPVQSPRSSRCRGSPSSRSRRRHDRRSRAPCRGRACSAWRSAPSHGTPLASRRARSGDRRRSGRRWRAARGRRADCVPVRNVPSTSNGFRACRARSRPSSAPSWPCARRPRTARGRSASRAPAQPAPSETLPAFLRFDFSNTTGASGLRAASSPITDGRRSLVILMAAMASSAVFRSFAATAAIGSPT